MAGAGDVDNDGVADLVAGAALFDDVFNDEGRAETYLGRPSTNPLPGEILYYVIRPENVCGVGPVGFDSSLAPRIAGPCP